jgi:hypothetical protein
VPRGWPYVAIIEHVTDSAAHARTLGSYRPGSIRPGSVLLIAHQFGELAEAVVYRGGPVGEHSAFLVPLASPLALEPGRFARVHARRAKGR